MIISRINPNPSPTTFGIGGEIKKIAKHCAYTGREFRRSNQKSFEHILPRSRGGGGDMSNGLITLPEPNHQRGNMPFSAWLKLQPKCAEHIQNYLDELRGIQINGRNYVNAVVKTLNKQAKGLFNFK